MAARIIRIKLVMSLVQSILCTINTILETCIFFTQVKLMCFFLYGIKIIISKVRLQFTYVGYVDFVHLLF